MSSPHRVYAPMFFNGGPIMTGFEIDVLYLGAFSAAEIAVHQDWLRGYAAYLSASAAPGGQEPTLFQYGVSGAVVGTFHLVSALPTRMPIAESDVHDEVIRAQAAGSLPTFSPERLFLVLTKGITFIGRLAGRDCAYHSDWGDGKYFAICPQPVEAACLPFGRLIDDSWHAVISHEIQEAATDPQRGHGWSNELDEGADTCQDSVGRVGSVALQRFADNMQLTCSAYSPAQSTRVSGLSRGDDSYDIFFADPAGTPMHWSWNGSRWSSQSLGGQIIGRMCPVSCDPGRIDLFARGTDNAVYQNTLIGRQWSGWNTLFGVIVGDPVAVRPRPGRLALIVHGTDGNHYLDRFDGSRWSGWQDIGGRKDVVGTPVAVCSDVDRIDVISRGNDFRLQYNFFDGSIWRGWQDVGGQSRSRPAMVTRLVGHLDVFTRAADGGLQQTWYDGTWHGWYGLGGVIPGEPTAVSWADDRLDVFAQGTDGALWQWTWANARWTGPSWLGGTITSAPLPVSWAADRLGVFCRATDGSLVNMHWDGAWHGFDPVGGVIG